MCQNRKTSFFSVFPIFKKIVSTWFVLALLDFSAPVLAVEEIKLNGIESLSTEILKKKFPGKTLFVFDWDHTIVDGDRPLNIKENKKTLEVLKGLIENKHPILVMTARGNGQSPTESSAVGESAANSMLGVLKENKIIFTETISHSQGLLLNKEVCSELKNDDVIYLTPNVVFSGSKKDSKTNSNKAIALKYILDHKLLKEIPEKIVFIDDKETEIKQMVEYFKNKEEGKKLIVYHYTAN